MLAVVVNDFIFKSLHFYYQNRKSRMWFSKSISKGVLKENFAAASAWQRKRDAATTVVFERWFLCRQNLVGIWRIEATQHTAFKNGSEQCCCQNFGIANKKRCCFAAVFCLDGRYNVCVTFNGSERCCCQNFGIANKKRCCFCLDGRYNFCVTFSDVVFEKKFWRTWSSPEFFSDQSSPEFFELQRYAVASLIFKGGDVIPITIEKLGRQAEAASTERWRIKTHAVASLIFKKWWCHP